MIGNYLSAIFARELAGIDRELGIYGEDSQIWETPAGILNSAGTLTLHVCGNLQHFIGAQLGGDGYVRDRDREFSARGVPRPELLEELERARRAVHAVLADRTEFSGKFPIGTPGVEIDTLDFLLHLVAHLAYHAGQISYHRRTVTGDDTSTGPVSMKALRSARET